MRLTHWLLGAALLSAGCSASRSLEPLKKGTGSLTASFGGPINADLGAAIPLPISSVGYMHGLDGKTNVYGAFYPSGLVFFGVPGIDVGISREVLTPEKARPRIMLDAVLYGFAGDAQAGQAPPPGVRVWTDFASSFVWPVGNHLVFTKVDLFVQPGPAFNAYLNPHVGARLNIKRVGLQVEYTWWGPWVNTRFMQPVWIGPGKTLGASTIQFGLNIKLGNQEDET